MCTGNANSIFIGLHNHTPGLRALKHRYAQAAGSSNLRIVIMGCRCAYNAVSVIGDAVEHSFYYGKGAGELPTASAVVADVIDTIVGRTKITFDTLHLWDPEKKPENIEIAKAADVTGRYYLRVMVEDRLGVIADLADILSKAGISICSCVQENANGKIIPIIIMTHETTEGAILGALESINKLDCVVDEAVRMRIYG